MLNSNLSRIGTVTLLALLLLVAMALTFMRRVVRPITNLVSDMRRLADGDLSVIPAGTARNDEIGNMCRAVEVFHTNAISHAALVRAQELEHRESRLRQDRVEQLVRDFRSDAEAALTPLATNAMVEVTAPAGETPASAQQVLKASGLVNKAAQNLRSRTERFLSDVKAA
jgi:methyl-accepting chemotaxis protein